MIKFKTVDSESINVAEFPVSQGDHPTIILEPKWLYNKALIGWCEERSAYVYDYYKMILAICKGYDLDEQEAIDHIQFNTMGTLDYILHCRTDLKPCIIVEQDFDTSEYIILSGIEITQNNLEEPIKLHCTGDIK